MGNWNYIRFCPYCNDYKPYPGKNSPNNKTRCPDCLTKYFAEKYKTFKCKYCNKMTNKFKTNDLKSLLEHFITCRGLIK